jgi:hypothetical protein
MSNHYSAANLRFPGDDARLDFTDPFVLAERSCPPHASKQTRPSSDALICSPT